MVEMLGNPYRRNILEHCYIGNVKALKHIQEQFQLSHRTALYHVNLLEKAKLIRVTQDKNSVGKAKELSITALGEKELQKFRPDLFAKK